MSDSWARTSPSSRRAEAPDDPGEGHRRWHAQVLVASGLIVLLAFALEVRPDGLVAIRGLPGRPLPQVCAARAGLGLNCPACGLTRSLIRLARGDFAASWREHRLGGLLGGVIAFQVPYRGMALRRRGRLWLSPRREWSLAGVLVALLLGNWILDGAARLGAFRWP